MRLREYPCKELFGSKLPSFQALITSFFVAQLWSALGWWDSLLYKVVLPFPSPPQLFVQVKVSNFHSLLNCYSFGHLFWHEKFSHNLPTAFANKNKRSTSCWVINTKLVIHMITLYFALVHRSLTAFELISIHGMITTTIWRLHCFLVLWLHKLLWLLLSMCSCSFHTGDTQEGMGLVHTHANRPPSYS